MDGEIDGLSPGDMELPPEDLKTEINEKNREELSGIAKKVFADEPGMRLEDDTLEKIGMEAGDILEKYNFGTDLDDQFHGDIVRLAGEKVGDTVEDIPSKLQSGLVTEQGLRDRQITLENKEKWWVEAAYRLLRERQRNPVDDRETVRVLVEAMRPSDGGDQYDRLTSAMAEKSSDLQRKYGFDINPDVRFLSEIVDYSWIYETATSTAIYPGSFEDKGTAERNKERFDAEEDDTIISLRQDFLDRHK